MKRILILAALALVAFGCGDAAAPTPNGNINSAASNLTASPNPTVEYNSDQMRPDPTGVAIATPKPGKANIQGKVFFNSSPAVGVEVKLCVTANTFADCIGEKHLIKTDENGQYLFADLEPKTYGGLFVREFQTRNYIFTGKYGFAPLDIVAEADKTFFVPLTNLFKSDLKVLNPRKEGKSDANNFEIAWEPYPDAQNYKLELLEYGGVRHLDGQQTRDTAFKIDRLLPNGRYRLRIEAFNSIRIKIAQAPDVEFIIINGAPPNKDPK